MFEKEIQTNSEIHLFLHIQLMRKKKTAPGYIEFIP